ncbi:MAG TPA: metalloregulator ArsR/SmtB family transcription factor [Pseudomonadales bacterium]|nr:metalloregulator ArsR/SmtB family transcription factor [Pseudomonadales bacterium]
MVPLTATPQTPVDSVFRALADPTRRALVERLTVSRASVSELAAPLAMSLNAVSKHLKILEAAGLVRRERAGRLHVIHLRPESLDPAQRWLEAQSRAWETRFDDLAAILAADAEADR